MIGFGDLNLLEFDGFKDLDFIELDGFRDLDLLELDRFCYAVLQVEEFKFITVYGRIDGWDSETKKIIKINIL